ncbi:MAG: pyruvate kinase [Chloroflexi bacterium]|nr:pyruvate kinase [Chloroflexota bacterium]
MKPPRYLQRQTKIVCTTGPATSQSLVIERLVRAGMNCARLNLSHGTFSEHASTVARVRAISQRLDIPIAVLIDLPGPKYRTGAVKGGSTVLTKGSQFTLTTRQIEGDENITAVNFPNFTKDVKVGDTVLVDDGAIQLRVQEIKGSDVRTRVLVGGTLTPRKGIVVPGMHSSMPFMTDQLREYLSFALQQEPDYIALSFVGGPEDVVQVRKVMETRGYDVPLITKIERGEAVASFDGILAASDGIMVARGDLGVQIPLEKVPLVQKEIIRKCNQAGKPVITATQMLESMVHSSLPNRAEVTDVANAIFDGTDAIMLSAETSIGKYPVLAVKMMAKIARETEKSLPLEHRLIERGKHISPVTAEVISYNACQIAHQLNATVVVAFTQSGSTARRVSKYRPGVPILAITPPKSIGRRLLLSWGVYPFEVARAANITELFTTATSLARDLGLARSGDLIVITGGIPVGVSGSTNLIKVETCP